MTVYEMEGFLRGKCLPGDMKVNESNAQYLVRKFSELQSQNADMAVQLANSESKFSELATELSAARTPMTTGMHAPEVMSPVRKVARTQQHRSKSKRNVKQHYSLSNLML